MRNASYHSAGPSAPRSPLPGGAAVLGVRLPATLDKSIYRSASLQQGGMKLRHWIAKRRDGRAGLLVARDDGPFPDGGMLQVAVLFPGGGAAHLLSPYPLPAGKSWAFPAFPEVVGALLERNPCMYALRIFTTRGGEEENLFVGLAGGEHLRVSLPLEGEYTAKIRLVLWLNRHPEPFSCIDLSREGRNLLGYSYSHITKVVWELREREFRVGHDKTGHEGPYAGPLIREVAYDDGRTRRHYFQAASEQREYIGRLAELFKEKYFRPELYFAPNEIGALKAAAAKWAAGSAGTELPSKSSRYKAELFELLVASGCARHAGLSKSFDGEIAEVKRKLPVLQAVDQNERVTRAMPHIQRLLAWTKGRYGELVDVKWVGRDLESPSDVDISFSGGSALGLSLKSVESGYGTLRNVGATKLGEHLGLDVGGAVSAMWNHIKEDIKVSPELRRLLYDEKQDTISKTGVDKAAPQSEALRGIGAGRGRHVKEVATAECVRRFNLLANDGKVLFVRHLLGLDSEKAHVDIIDVVVTGGEVHVVSRRKYLSAIQGAKLVAAPVGSTRGSPISYKIRTEDGRALMRIQSSFTNYAGLSPFCQRVFMEGIPHEARETFGEAP